MNAPKINVPRSFRPEPGDPGRPRRGLDEETLVQQTTVFRDDLLAGHTMLISGAGSGMGKAAAYLAARLGANVAICGRALEKLEGTAALIRNSTGREILCQSANIRDPDAVEALIGAVYLDAGYSVAEALVHRLFKAVEINPQMQAVAKDPKTELQEWLQGRKMKVPTYRVIATLGAAHRQTFDEECDIPELGIVERGIGGSRRAGEQAAATAVLALLKARKT